MVRSEHRVMYPGDTRHGGSSERCALLRCPLLRCPALCPPPHTQVPGLTWSRQVNVVRCSTNGLPTDLCGSLCVEASSGIH